MRNRKRASKGKRADGANGVYLHGNQPGCFGGTKADYKIVKIKIQKRDADGVPVLTKSGKPATKTVKRIVGRTISQKGTIGAKRANRVYRAKRI